MCGICGFIGDGDQELLTRMNEAIKHRGPDDRGLFFQHSGGVASQRLSVIDVRGGHQPKFNEDGSLVIVFNGEIYNFQEIQKKLIREGHRFRSQGDTETVLHAYEEYGERCVERFNGMFAFAVFDARKGELFLARDRLGIKPLYYTQVNNLFLFASEIKSLLEYQGLKREIDFKALDYYFTFRYTPEKDTLFKGIKKLEPGCVGKYENNQLRVKKYWDLVFQEDSSRSESEHVEEFKERFSSAVKKRLISEVPLGAFLSGGLDSSFVVGTMSKLVPKPVETFSIGFEDERYSELEYAEVTAKHFNTHHHPSLMTADSFSLLEKIIWHLDEPIADPAAIPTFLMSQAARKYITVVLTGDGADESLAGYSKYKILTYGSLLKLLFPRILEPIFRNILNKQVKHQRILEFLSAEDRVRECIGLGAAFSEEEKAKLFSPSLRKQIPNPSWVRDSLKPYFMDNRDYLSQLLYLDFKTWLVNDPLLKVDKMTMAHGLEARVPFLDHELVEFLAKLPSGLKLHWFTEKYLLRKAMTKLVPKRIQRRKKQTFDVPLEIFLREGRKVLSQEIVKERGFFNPAYIQEVLSKDLNNPYYQQQFWCLLSFELWCRIFIDT